MDPSSFPAEFPVEYPQTSSAPVGGTITGTTTEDGSPAAITVILSQSGTPVYSTVSVQDGEVYRFTITGIVPGTYDVETIIGGVLFGVVSNNDVVNVGNVDLNRRR